MQVRLVIIASITAVATLVACDVDPNAAYGGDGEVYDDAYGDVAPDSNARTIIGREGARGPSLAEPPPVSPAPPLPTPTRTVVSETVVLGPVATPGPIASRAGGVTVVAAPAPHEPQPKAEEAPTAPAEGEDDDEADEPPFDGAVGWTRLYWGPKGKRFGVMHVELEEGGTGYTDVSGKIVRRRDGAVRHERVLAHTGNWDYDGEEEADPTMKRRGLKFHRLLLAKGYAEAKESEFESAGDDEDEEDDDHYGYEVTSAELSEGSMKGLRIDVEEAGQDRVRIWATAPGSKRRRLVARASVELEECWTMEHKDEADMYPDALRRGDELCHVGTPNISRVWTAPDGGHVVVEITASPGPGCRTNTMSSLVVGRLR